MSIDISKNFSAERCMGSPFRVAVCFKEFHCNPVFCD